MKNKIRIVMDYETDLNKELEAQKVKHFYIATPLAIREGAFQYLYIGLKLIEDPFGALRHKL